MGCCLKRKIAYKDAYLAFYASPNYGQTLEEDFSKDPHNNYKRCSTTLFFSSSIYKRSLWRKKVDNNNDNDNHKSISTRMWTRS